MLEDRRGDGRRAAALPVPVPPGVTGAPRDAGWTRLVPALLAAPALVFVDYLLVGGMFIYQPAGGEAFIVALLVGTLAAVALRRRWLLLATQNMVTALAFLRAAQMTDPPGWGESLPVLALLLSGNLLAWLVARAFPRAVPGRAGRT